MRKFEVVKQLHRIDRKLSGAFGIRGAGMLLLGIIFCGLPVYAADECAHGTVTNEAGEPVEGATLYFEKKTDWDDAVTDAEGKFSFDCSPVRYTVENGSTVQPVIGNNVLSFSIDRAAVNVRCDIFTLGGRRVKTITEGIHAPQEYNYELGLDALSAGTYIISLRIGESRHVQRITLSDNGMLHLARNAVSSEGFSLSKSAGEAAEKEEEVIDKLICQADGYELQILPVTSYLATFDFVLTVIDEIPPVVTFKEGTDTIRIHYDMTDSIATWFDEEYLKENATISDDIDTAPQFMPPVQTLLDHSKPGIYTIKVSARDASNNIGSSWRLLVLCDSTVTDDTIPPEINFASDTLRLTTGSLFDPDTGVTATDAVDTMVNLTTWISVTDDIETTRERTGFITVDVPGTYTITYRIIDTSLNLTERTRVIIVEDAAEEEEPAE